MRRPGKLHPEAAQYSLWSESYGWGNKVGSVTTLQTLAGYSGYGKLRKPNGSLLALGVSILPETVTGEGGQVVLSLDLLELSPGSYPFDVWLTPPEGAAFQWATGELVINPSVSPRP